ncbi:MAG: ATP-binding cassette domain-containing protein, partial [Planctomycetota bacterium]
GKERVKSVERPVQLDQREIGVGIDSQDPSGSGKSTLLLIAGGMMRPSSGTVSHNGEDLYSLSPAERTVWRRKHVGFVFQQIHLLPYLNVRDNIRLSAGKISKSELNRWLSQLELADRATHRPAELSVGEQQRVALIRAIIGKPALLMADEPISHLDPESAGLVVEALDAYRTDGGAVMMVTHHEVVGTERGPRSATLLTMKDGELLESEPVA